MYELRYAEKEIQDRIKEMHGDGNQFPKGWREISMEEFATSRFFSHHPKYIEHRQMCKDDDGKFMGQPAVCCTLYHNEDGTGFSIVQQWEQVKPYSKRITHVKFFAFGCKHDFKELGSKEARAKGITHHGMCWHVNECQKCGTIMSYDSSG